MKDFIDKNSLISHLLKHIEEQQRILFLELISTCYSQVMSVLASSNEKSDYNIDWLKLGLKRKLDTLSIDERWRPPILKR